MSSVRSSAWISPPTIRTLVAARPHDVTLSPHPPRFTPTALRAVLPALRSATPTRPRAHAPPGPSAPDRVAAPPRGAAGFGLKLRLLGLPFALACVAVAVACAGVEIAVLRARGPASWDPLVLRVLVPSCAASLFLAAGLRRRLRVIAAWKRARRTWNRAGGSTSPRLLAYVVGFLGLALTGSVAGHLAGPFAWPLAGVPDASHLASTPGSPYVAVASPCVVLEGIRTFGTSRWVGKRTKKQAMSLHVAVPLCEGASSPGERPSAGAVPAWIALRYDVTTPAGASTTERDRLWRSHVQRSLEGIERSSVGRFAWLAELGPGPARAALVRAILGGEGPESAGTAELQTLRLYVPHHEPFETWRWRGAGWAPGVATLAFGAWLFVLAGAPLDREGLQRRRARDAPRRPA
jgi:hypothetical protein